MIMKWVNLLLIYLISGTGVACAQTIVVDKKNNLIEIKGGMRRLPFQFSVPAGDRPKTLLDAAEMIYRALPKEHLDVVAAYIGYKSSRKTYYARVDFENDLYAREILNKAWSDWGFLSGNDPFDASIGCVGERQLPMWMMLQVGFLYIKDQARSGDRPNYNQVEGFRQAELASRRLFETCDGTSRTH